APAGPAERLRAGPGAVTPPTVPTTTPRPTAASTARPTSPRPATRSWSRRPMAATPRVATVATVAMAATAAMSSAPSAASAPAGPEAPGAPGAAAAERPAGPGAATPPTEPTATPRSTAASPRLDPTDQPPEARPGHGRRTQGGHDEDTSGNRRRAALAAAPCHRRVRGPVGRVCHQTPSRRGRGAGEPGGGRVHPVLHR